MNRVIKHSAFTLSEVMLVLSVIGVVAALTLPGLIQSTQNKILVAQLKKEYSVLSQAYTAVVADNDGDITPIFTGVTDADDANAMNVFASKMNVLKNCGTGMGCWYNTDTKLMNGNLSTATFDTTFSGKLGKSMLADGTMLRMDIFSVSCTADKGDGVLDSSVCGNVQIDVNGAKGPNVIGRDYFNFWITKMGIFPNGSNGDGLTCISSNGDGCAAKVLQEGAMNY